MVAFKKSSVARNCAKNTLKAANRNNSSSSSISARLVVSSLAILIAALVSPAQQQHQQPLAAQACQQVQTNYGIVCSCTQTKCDSELKFEWPADDASLLKMVSNEAGARFQLSSLTGDELLAMPTSRHNHNHQPHFRVELDINRRHQQVVGYGGAFTDSASMLIMDKLNGGCREQLMRSYFAPTGLNYNLARVPIGGTDMSWRPYSYDDLDSDQNGKNQVNSSGLVDFELKRFKLQPEDFDYKLPLIRWAIKLRPDEEPLRLLASSWSAPNWMKSNNKLVQGRLKEDTSGHHDRAAHKHGAQKGIDGKYYDAYARYIIRFLDEYERLLSAGSEHDSEVNSSNNSTRTAQFKIWALTPQNEPCTPGRLGHSVVNYNSVNFSPAQMGRFVRCHLVPNLLRSNRTARDTALFVWDDTLLGLDKYKDHLFRQGGVRNSRSRKQRQSHDQDNELDQDDDQHQQLADQYIRGLALHWYSQGLDKVPYKAMYELRRWLPSRFSMLSTEASFIGRPQPGNWSRGERYARDIIMNLRSGSLGWIDWNLALNLNGGPTWSHNYLDSAVLIDEQSRTYAKNPMFYAIGHLSRFIKAGSHILDSQIGVATDSTLPPTETTWRLVDEHAEQTSELLVVASEQTQQPSPERPPGKPWRQIALVLLNRAPSERRVSLAVPNCQSRILNGDKGQLQLELSARSITSLAFNC